MAIDWNGIAISLVDKTATNYETRVHRQILFAGLIGLILIIVWKLMR